MFVTKNRQKLHRYDESTERQHLRSLRQMLSPGNDSYLRLCSKVRKFPGDPKPLVTSQPYEKVSIQIVLHQMLQKRK